MFQRVLNTCQRFAKWARQTNWRRHVISLNVTVLEERATPAAAPSPALLIPPAQVVVTAPMVAAPAAATPGATAITASQTIVRLDLIAACESTHVGQDDIWNDADAQADAIFAKVQPPAQAPAADADATEAQVSDAELAELQAAQEAA